MANIITISRFPVLALAILLMYLPGTAPKLVAVPVILILILMDTLDGIIARARKETSLLGSVLDIMADRSVEVALWICFAHLRLVPVVIPLVFAVRGIVVDSLRSFSVGRGITPFEGMRSRAGRWLVGSPWMRSTYGVSKAISFAGLALTNALYAISQTNAAVGSSAALSHTLFSVTSWIALALCLLRGMPVIIEAVAYFRQAGANPG